jgi:hypothetical protein
LTPALIDVAWGNYFGTAHGFAPDRQFELAKTA